MNNFDVFIIGTGTAGETAATMLRDAGLTVAIADNDDYGGTCALRGCQPKKYLVVPAHAALEGAGLTQRGFVKNPQLDWAAIQRSRAEFTDAVPEGTEDGLRERGITTFHGTCRFLDVGTDAITVQCGSESIRAKRILVATGARPRPLPIPGGELARSSDDFLNLPELPQHVTFIGGGYISMEFATVAVAAGAEVTVVQRGNRVMDRFDPDLVEELQRGCAARSIDIVTNAETASITSSRSGGGSWDEGRSGGAGAPGAPDDTSRPGAQAPQGAHTRPFSVNLADGTAIETDLVLAALGRVPNTDTLDLENAGIEASPRGIATDGTMRTSVPGVYAAGDCVASIQLSPVSDAEARVAARNIILDLAGPDPAGSDDVRGEEGGVASDSGARGNSDVHGATSDPGTTFDANNAPGLGSVARADRPHLDLSVLPTVVFTYPQLAQFGLSEAEARERGGVRINTGSGAGWPNYRRLNESHVMYKVMIDEETDRILGAHILAPQAGELINLLALAAKAGTPAREFREFPWAYPTYTGDLKYMLG